jgi:hypothetical protein
MTDHGMQLANALMVIISHVGCRGLVDKDWTTRARDRELRIYFLYAVVCTLALITGQPLWNAFLVCGGISRIARTANIYSAVVAHSHHR